MTTLGVYVAQGRDNNLNLLRMLASIAVLVSHAWPLVYGISVLQPLQMTTGEDLGSHAVILFFVLSGFLIAASFERSRSLSGYMVARVARLFPGLIVANVLVVFGLGLWVTTWSTQAYLADLQTWKFFLGNSAILLPNYELPGVFEDNPMRSVHGSIWSLRYELACYVLVLILGVIGLLASPGLLCVLALLGYGGIWMALEFAGLDLPAVVLQLYKLSGVFMVGVMAWLWRGYVPLSIWGVAAFFALAWLTLGSEVQFVSQVLFVAYAGFYLGYVPAGTLRLYNRFGDYSYGTYIYAFPVQGLVVWAVGVTVPLTHIALALPLTLVLAVMSWHFVEEPALKVARRIIRNSAPRS